MDAAIRREKQLKEWRRLWKIRPPTHFVVPTLAQPAGGL